MILLNPNKFLTRDTTLHCPLNVNLLNVKNIATDAFLYILALQQTARYLEMLFIYSH